MNLCSNAFPSLNINVSNIALDTVGLYVRVFIINFEHILHLFQVFLVLAFNM